MFDQVFDRGREYIWVFFTETYDCVTLVAQDAAKTVALMIMVEAKLSVSCITADFALGLAQ